MGEDAGYRASERVSNFDRMRHLRFGHPLHAQSQHLSRVFNIGDINGFKQKGSRIACMDS